jgi:hypothetical protein
MAGPPWPALWSGDARPDTGARHYCHRSHESPDNTPSLQRADTLQGVRLTMFWDQMGAQFGPAYAQSVAKDYVLAGLGGRTVEQALADGEDIAVVWRAVCEAFEVPERLRLTGSALFSVFSGVSAAVEYTFPLLLDTRVPARAVPLNRERGARCSPKMSEVPRTVCTNGRRGPELRREHKTKHKTTWAVREEPAGP